MQKCNRDGFSQLPVGWNLCWKHLKAYSLSCLPVNCSYWQENLSVAVSAGIHTSGLSIWPGFPHTMAVWDQYAMPLKDQTLPCLNILAQIPSKIRCDTSQWRPAKKHNTSFVPRSLPTWYHLGKEEERQPKKKNRLISSWTLKWLSTQRKPGYAQRALGRFKHEV